MQTDGINIPETTVLRAEIHDGFSQSKQRAEQELITEEKASNETVKKRRIRRALKKNKRNNFMGENIKIVAINCAGITSKMESFNKMLCDIKPSIWLLQETKRRIYDPKMKANNLINYQVFELRREKSAREGGKGLNGGGLAVGALHDLSPVLLQQGDDEVECMTVELTTGSTRLRCVVGYGPQ